MGDVRNVGIATRVRDNIDNDLLLKLRGVIY